MNASDLIADAVRSGGGSPGDRIVRIARVAVGQHDPPSGLPRYFGALRRAVDEEPPPFGMDAYTEVYRDASADGQWLAVSLIANAQREGDGATRLWSLAACSPDVEDRALLKRHATDESHHSLAYLALLDLTFPGATEPEFRVALNALSPHYGIGQDVVALEGSPYARTPTIDDFVQMNIAEIRTTIHHSMQRVAIATHCPPESLPRVRAILDSLLRDELQHVAYTANLIEREASRLADREVERLFCRRVCDFNRITTSELASGTFSTCSTCVN